MSTLLEITDDLRALDDLLDEAGGDVTDPQVEQAVADWFAELDEAMDKKLDNYAALITEMMARAEVRAAEAQRLYHRSKMDQNSAAWLKDRLKSVLEERGMTKIETERYRISVAGNGGKQPLDIHNPEAVPREHCRHIPERWEPDGDAIRDALKSGKDVPGAILMKRGKHLRVK